MLIRVAAIALVSVAAAACGGGSQPTGRPAPTTAAASGQQIYAERCAACHGSKGQGGPGSRLAGGAIANRFPNAENEAAVVREGAAGGAMPPFGQILTPEQIDAVVAYTRGL